MEAGEKTQWLGALAVLAEDPSTVLSTLVLGSQPSLTPVPGNPGPSSDLSGNQA